MLYINNVESHIIYKLGCNVCFNFYPLIFIIMVFEERICCYCYFI